MRVQTATVARMFGLDREGRRELRQFAEAWQDVGLDQVSNLAAAVDAVQVLLVLGYRARGRTQRAEARRRRPALLATLMLAGAILESALPAPLDPGQWAEAVRRGRVAQA